MVLAFCSFTGRIAKRAQLEKLKRDLVKSYFIVHCLVVGTFNFSINIICEMENCFSVVLF